MANGRPDRAPQGVRSPACLARGGVWRRFDEKASSRSSGRGPLAGDLAVKGREARGAAERGHGQDASFFNARQGAGRGWRLAHGSALEALGELGRRLTVMRGVL
jgi:hypothetical protein